MWAECCGADCDSGRSGHSAGAADVGEVSEFVALGEGTEISGAVLSVPAEWGGDADSDEVIALSDELVCSGVGVGEGCDSCVYDEVVAVYDSGGDLVDLSDAGAVASV